MIGFTFTAEVIEFAEPNMFEASVSFKLLFETVLANSLMSVPPTTSLHPSLNLLTRDDIHCCILSIEKLSSTS